MRFFVIFDCFKACLIKTFSFIFLLAVEIRLKTLYNKNIEFMHPKG